MLSAAFSGGQNERLRALVRAEWEYAQSVVHARTDTQKKAHIAASATLFIVDTLRTLIPQPTGQLHDDYDREEEVEDEKDLDHDWEPDEIDLAYYAEHMGGIDFP